MGNKQIYNWFIELSYENTSHFACIYVYGEEKDDESFPNKYGSNHI